MASETYGFLLSIYFENRKVRDSYLMFVLKSPNFLVIASHSFSVVVFLRFKLDYMWYGGIAKW